MYRTHDTIDLQKPPEGNDVYARLNWLLAVNAQEEARRRLYRHAREAEELLLMRRPLSAQRALALFGLMLGLFPPAAIFIRIFGYGFGVHEGNVLLFFICLLMNFTCAGVGYVMGSVLGQSVATLERDTWAKTLIVSPLVGAAWGAATGGAGGLLFVGIGAIFGILYAVPIGALAFFMFAALHRLCARGGMIDARHFWPLASGITLVVAALVLGL